MKNSTKITAFFALSLLLSLVFLGCREEIELNTEYKETPIIFGLLDQSEDIHYIKINRGFVGPGNALEFAKIPDSNYFEQVDAQVEEFIGGQLVRTWPLRDTILTGKDTSGAFFAPNHKIYYFQTDNQNPLNADAVYRLTVNINGGKLIVKGETQLVKNFGTGSSITNSSNSFRFADNFGEYTAESLVFDKGTSAFANAKLRMLITEFRGSAVDTIAINWNLFEGTSNSARYSTSAQGEVFYDLVKKGVTNDASITKRNFLGMEIIFTGGATEFYNYSLISQPSSSLAQNKPKYTNLTVTDGFQVVGIFSARSTQTYYKPMVFSTSSNFRALDKVTTKFLCEGPITGELSFCSQHHIDQGESFKCN